MSRFMFGSPLSSVVSAPLSELILKTLSWRWMFFIEAAPVIVAGVCLLVWLPNAPSEVAWLSDEQKRALLAHVGLSRSAAARSSSARDAARALLLPSTWTLGSLSFANCMVMYGVQMWLPTILERLSATRLQVTLGIAVPYVAAMLAMSWGQRRSKSPRLLRRAAVAGGLSASIVLALAALPARKAPLASYGGLAISVPCIFSSLPSFLAYVPQDYQARLDGTGVGGDDARGVATGIAAVNAIGHVGAFVGPYLFGLLHTSSEALAIVVLAAPALVGHFIWGACGSERPTPEEPEEPSSLIS